MLNQSLYGIFSSEKLVDLIIVGYSDTIKGFKNFNPSMNSIFLKFEETIVRVESYDQYSKIKLSITNENAYSEASVRAEEDTLMIFPALDLYTRYTTNNINIEQVNLFFDLACDVENGIYRAIGISLVKKAGYLFFDPMNLSGILIGSYNQEETWLENWKDLQDKKNFSDIVQKTIVFNMKKTANKSLEYYMNLPYPILLTPPEQGDEDWFARIPLLRGCMTQAPSLEELWENIVIAKRLWIETMLEANQPIPEPERVR